MPDDYSCLRIIWKGLPCPGTGLPDENRWAGAPQDRAGFALRGVLRPHLRKAANTLCGGRSMAAFTSDVFRGSVVRFVGTALLAVLGNSGASITIFREVLSFFFIFPCLNLYVLFYIAVCWGTS